MAALKGTRQVPKASTAKKKKDTGSVHNTPRTKSPKRGTRINSTARTMEGDTSRVLVLVTANPRNSVVNSITDPLGYEVEETTESKEIEIDEDCS